MQRKIFKHLEAWLVSASSRKPLIIRGARQVGKTWLVRHLAEKYSKNLLELNFECQPDLIQLFDSNNPEQILTNLAAVTGKNTIPADCLLFLDEIQVVPELLPKLRWFAEDLPELAVIAAGSLLEFALAAHEFSMPVGRINYIYLEPMSFEEFLQASPKQYLLEYLAGWNMNTHIPESIHKDLMTLFREYVIIGGLPAVVASWMSEHSIMSVQQIQHDLLATYRDDFAKYSGRFDIRRLDTVLMSIPHMLGQKFIYSRINIPMQVEVVKKILGLLEKARLCYRVFGTHANGIPLGAELTDGYFKETFLDSGLCSATLGLNLAYINNIDELIMINNGSMAEQIVGQLLRTIEPPWIEPALYCWHRDTRGSNAEIDYVLQHGNQIIPIEVKAGSTGSMKSLHLFMGLKSCKKAVRINSDYPSQTAVSVTNSLGTPVAYNLLSIPFYLVEQLHRLLH